MKPLDNKYWVSGRTEDEARKKAAERFRISADILNLKQGNAKFYVTNVVFFI